MKSTITTALALALASWAAPASTQQYGGAAPAQMPAAPSAGATAPAPKIMISKKASKALIELQNAVNANDVANIPAKVAAAQAVAQTKEDRYAIGQLQLKAAVAAKDNAATVAAIDAVVASGVLDGARSAELYNAFGVQYYNAKDFARAGAAFERAATLDPRNAEPLKLLAETQNATGRKADGAATLMKALQVLAASGQKPGEDLYKRAVAMAYEGKSPTAIAIGRQWIAAYPNANSWRNAIAIYRNLMQPNIQGSLDLLRLMRAAGAMSTAGDYTLLATAAADQGNFAEAQAVMDEGLAAKRVALTNAVARDTVNGLKTKPKATAADLNASAKTAAGGASLVKIGDRFYGIGEYARAAEVYREAIAKGGADADLANLHLGMALARSGDKAGAATALKAVGGSQAEIAKYWLIYVGGAA